MARYLTKSRFQIARECPRKLFYTNKPQYAGQKDDDPFLAALAEGGYQVGALARAYFPEGHNIETLEYAESVRQTNALLQLDKVTLYEAAFIYNNLFVRADIVIKTGTELKLIEVKSKSNDSHGIDSMRNKNGSIASTWKPYLEDVAFQKYVASSACPNLDVHAYLVTVDKDKPCPTDGLNQKFRIITNEHGRKTVVQTEPLSQEERDQKILRIDPVDDLCDLIWQDTYPKPDGSNRDCSFFELIGYFSDCYVRDQKIRPQLTAACAKCEFKTDEEARRAGLISGFEECWKEMLGWTSVDFADPLIFDIGRLNSKAKAALLEEKRVKITQIENKDINLKSSDKPGLSQSERQLLQIQKIQNNDDSFWIDQANLMNEINNWVYPLHFIDFETAMAAIPFNRGIFPYEGIAFQFSHHIVYKDKCVVHKGQFINAEPGYFPNFDFIRALKRELDQDDGSIFRYATHENTYLRMIRNQIAKADPILEDKDDLIHFIDSITEYSVGKGRQIKKIKGPRNMIDLCDLVMRYYFDPIMKGSVSIKKVLPAILKNSKYLQRKYS